MKIWRLAVAAIVALAVAAGSAGCSSSNPTASTSGRLPVTVAFYPFQFIAERIGGELVAVTNLTPPGSEPHDLELTPKQVASLGTAGLLIYQHGFQPAVDAAIETVTPKRSVDTASLLTLQTSSEEGHDQGALDPHTWLDPNNMIAITDHVRDALAAADPAATGTFSANAKALIADLTTLDTEFRNGLTGCRRTVFVTSHEAFGYLAQRYGLQQVGIRGIEPDTEPTAARIAQVQAIARTSKVTTIFFETLVSPAVAQSVAGDLGLQTDVLDPLEGLTADSLGSDYLQVMGSNLTALRKANGCP